VIPSQMGAAGISGAPLLSPGCLDGVHVPSDLSHSQQRSRHKAHAQLQPDRTALATAGG
jgi:hypothetical protein